MQIDISSENSLTFKITDDGDGAIDVFYNIMKKCRTEAQKRGFRNMFSDQEKLFIIAFTDKTQYDEIKYQDNT